MNKTRQFLGRRKKLLIAVFITLLLAAGAFAFYKTNIETPSVTSTPSTTQEQDQQAAQQGESQKNPGSVQANGQSDKQGGGSSSTSGPTAPQGNFVSSHKVGLSDSVESICITSTGAACQISFTSGGITKTLEEKLVNSSGSASWIWSPASIGLNPGYWEIVANARYNNQEKQTKDLRNLEVTP